MPTFDPMLMTLLGLARQRMLASSWWRNNRIELSERPLRPGIQRTHMTDTDSVRKRFARGIAIFDNQRRLHDRQLRTSSF